MSISNVLSVNHGLIMKQGLNGIISVKNLSVINYTSTIGGGGLMNVSFMNENSDSTSQNNILLEDILLKNFTIGGNGGLFYFSESLFNMRVKNLSISKITSI